MDCAISTQHLAFHIEENIKKSRSGMITMFHDVLSAIRTIPVPFFSFFLFEGVGEEDKELKTVPDAFRIRKKERNTAPTVTRSGSNDIY